MEQRHINCKTLPIQRSAGQSAVASAAYRAAQRLHDTRQDKQHNFVNRSPDVSDTLILAPEDAPDWAHDRATCWNNAEAAETRKDGRPARDIQLGLAWELPEALQREAVLAWVKRELVDRGLVADIAFHRYGKRLTEHSDEGRTTIREWAKLYPFMEATDCATLNAPHVKIERSQAGQVLGYKIYQPHAHVLISTRTLSANGFARTKERWIDKAETAMNWRYDWPKFHNSYLEKMGSDVRVTATAKHTDDERLPLRSESLSREAKAMLDRGAKPKEPSRIGMRRAHNTAVRLLAQAQKRRKATPAIDAGAQFARWWDNAVTALPERYGHMRERAEHYWHQLIERGRDHDR